MLKFLTAMPQRHPCISGMSQTRFTSPRHGVFRHLDYTYPNSTVT